MDALSSFSFGSAPVRVVLRDGEPWFIAADVCKILALENVGQAIASLDGDEKRIINHGEMVDLGICNRDDLDITRLAIISEPGLYQLIFKSRKDEALAFKKWVVSEVLPSIRKTGAYALPSREPSKLEILEMALASEKRRLVLEAQVVADAPKVEFAMAVRNTTEAITIGKFAKLLGEGEVRFFSWLREARILFRAGKSNLPFQQYVDRGYFRVVENTINMGSARGIVPVPQTLITGKGQVWLERRFREDHSARALPALPAPATAI